VILNRFLAADLVFILGILLLLWRLKTPLFSGIAVAPSARRVPDGCFQADQSPKSIENRHGMPCRTVLEAAYSDEHGKSNTRLVGSGNSALC
jgi:hypothetical protein